MANALPDAVRVLQALIDSGEISHSAKEYIRLYMDIQQTHAAFRKSKDGQIYGKGSAAQALDRTPNAVYENLNKWGLEHGDMLSSLDEVLGKSTKFQEVAEKFRKESPGLYVQSLAQISPSFFVQREQVRAMHDGSDPEFFERR